MLATLLSQTEGAGKVLHGGFIVYTKANKTAAVGVPPELLEEQTAVSADVARAMAEGGLTRCPATIVVAITGVTGPEPDEDGNPVGLVFSAAAVRDGRIEGVRLQTGKREKEEICRIVMSAALDLVENLLLAHRP
jgi:nicotinamide-nucleotide amidase